MLESGWTVMGIVRAGLTDMMPYAPTEKEPECGRCGFTRGNSSSKGPEAGKSRMPEGQWGGQHDQKREWRCGH